MIMKQSAGVDVLPLPPALAHLRVAGVAAVEAQPALQLSGAGLTLQVPAGPPTHSQDWLNGWYQGAYDAGARSFSRPNQVQSQAVPLQLPLQHS
jgi:hypothetical protein